MSGGFGETENVFIGLEKCLEVLVKLIIISIDLEKCLEGLVKLVSWISLPPPP